ncbi:putative mitochondrial protein [Tanacetum coccineum]
MNEKFDQLTNLINQVVHTQQFLVTGVTRLKNGEGASRFSRLDKLEFPKFYGDDVKGWMYIVKQFFAVDDVREEYKVKIVSIHIYDRALAWNLHFVRAQGENVTWPVYEEAIFKRFWEVNEDPMAELNNLRYKITMKQYQRYSYDLEQAKKYMLGHKYSGQMFVLEVSPDEKEDIEDNIETNLEEEVESPNENGELLLSKCYASPQISLNAISGVPTYNTMRMKAMVTKHLLHLLIDTGSTYNFLDLFTTKKLRCELTKTYPLQVTVARGNKMISQYKWNFHELVMKFMYEGQKVCLRGTKQSELQWINRKQLQKCLVGRNNDCYTTVNCIWPAASLNLMHSTAVGREISLELQTLLEEFDDVFTEPTKLPPQRSCDHKCPMKDDSAIVNIRPYGYPPSQKDVIETMVANLLASGVVRESHSSFSSPIVLVKNKDGTWRMCIDYRQLNKNTIKDKFPIPVIEELIDELHGTQVFSKLDLRSGYHQIRMEEEDIHKTAFKSYEGHYKFMEIHPCLL